VLHRVRSFFDWFDISGEERERAIALAREVADDPQSSNDFEDYCALGAAALHRKPRRIFEIGTYRGMTSDFFLRLLPECRVVSIAYVRSGWRRKKANNSQLSKDEVGHLVADERRDRYEQLLGDSHKLRAEKMLRRFGPFDLVFIDGDHSAEGVRRDTELARGILAPVGTICWHDANPKPRYLAVRHFLEGMELSALATSDTYVGGVACWNPETQARLSSTAPASAGATPWAGAPG
jgi:predicted O-methyltransferase YrrM